MAGGIGSRAVQGSHLLLLISIGTQSCACFLARSIAAPRHENAAMADMRGGGSGAAERDAGQQTVLRTRRQKLHKRRQRHRLTSTRTKELRERHGREAYLTFEGARHARVAHDQGAAAALREFRVLLARVVVTG